MRLQQEQLQQEQLRLVQLQQERLQQEQLVLQQLALQQEQLLLFDHKRSVRVRAERQAERNESFLYPLTCRR